MNQSQFAAATALHKIHKIQAVLVRHYESGSTLSKHEALTQIASIVGDAVSADVPAWASLGVEGQASDQPEIPPGFRLKADGSYVPEAMVADIDKLRDQTINMLIAQAKAKSADLAAFKAQAFSDIEAFRETSLEQYGVKSRSIKGNLTLTSFDGRRMIRLQIQDRLVFDERLHAAKSLIDECITSWSESARDEIKVLVNDAFRVDREGEINTARVLGLRRLPIKDDRWQRAMAAISDSVSVASSKPYVRFYERVGDSDQYTAISLDIAVV